MGKQHDTIPNEPQEAPVQPVEPEVQKPGEPQGRPVPAEAPDEQPQEIPENPGQD